MRSLMTLIARRTSGVSAKRRKLTGVGLGSRFAGAWYGPRIEGSAIVFLGTIAPAAGTASAAASTVPVHRFHKF